jgi:SNF2 family DNA or RNA helicase
MYHTPRDKAKIFNAFYNLYDNKINNTIKFNMEDKEELGSYILPTLKEISSKISIDPTISDEFYEEPLKASLYFDKKGNGIAVEVKFNYGDIDINPLKDKGVRSNDSILVRDVAQELKIIQALIDSGFEKQGYRLVMEKEENVINFIQNKIQQLSNLGEVYYSEEFKNIKIHNSPTIVSNVRINEQNLLEFDFNISEVEREELKDIFNAVKEKKRYYKLKKGGFIPLESEELQDFSNMIRYLNIKDFDLEKEKILLSTYNAIYMDEVVKSKKISVKLHESFDRLITDIKSVKHMDFKPSENLDTVMREYQKFGFKWLRTLANCGLGGILADEMGLGKTLQAIAFIESEINEGESIPALVIAPTSLVYNWKDEIEKFAPNLSTLIISGDKKERKVKLREVGNYNIIITSYPLIRRDIEEYKEITFKYCFLDEAQHIKNPSSINSRSVKEIKAKAYFALTGTPIENSLTELWSIFDFIMPGYLMNHNKFLQNYEVPIVKDNDKIALQELNRHIKPFILRRLKKDVLSELPPKIEHKVLVEMTKEQKKLYAAYLTQFKEDLSIEIKEKGFKKSRLKILAMLTRLRQICDDPSIFIDNYKGDSGKMETLLGILEESISSEHRILLFSQFTTVLKNIEKILIKEKIDYMYLDGKTKMEDRVNMVKEFNNGKSKVFLISLKAGGTGLNLTGADTVIHFDPWWNPAVEDQATDRAHRIGQKNTVEVIKLISRGTIEEKIYNLQRKKREIINNVINSDICEENLISELSEDEVKDLFI